MSPPRRLPRECSLPSGQPKVRYLTRAEAKAAASRIHDTFGTDQHPYKCRVCGYFHLASVHQEAS